MIEMGEDEGDSKGLDLAAIRQNLDSNFKLNQADHSMHLHMNIHALSRLPHFYEDGYRVRVIYGCFNAENTWEALETLKTQTR